MTRTGALVLLSVVALLAAECVALWLMVEAAL